MRPLPRLLALTDDRIAAQETLGVGAAALAAVGPAVALVARLPGGTADALHNLACRFRALVAPPWAGLLVTGRADIAAGAGCGVVLRRQDPTPAQVRPLVGARPILASVHSEAEGADALDAGADGLIVGTIWPSASHPGVSPAGVPLLRALVALGAPVWAIGGVGPSEAAEAQAEGAWGVAAIRAVWDAPDPHRAALELVAPWLGGVEQ